MRPQEGTCQSECQTAEVIGLTNEALGEEAGLTLEAGLVIAESCMRACMQYMAAC